MPTNGLLERSHSPSHRQQKFSIFLEMQLLKGASSHWINENDLLTTKFAWGRGYGVFSVSHSGIAEVSRYIAGQEEHHRRRSFAEEIALLVRRYELKWKDEKTVKTVKQPPVPNDTPLKQGVNENA